MRENSLKIAFFFLAMLFSVIVRAQYIGAGSGTYSFLGLPTSSRQLELGGINVSDKNGDLAMALNNPALLSGATHMMLDLNFCYFTEQTMYGSVLYGHNFGRSADRPNYFAAGIHYLDYGTMPYADSYGNLTGGTFGARDILIDFVYARQLGPMFTVGVSLKPVISSYERYTAFALGSDVGAHFQLPDSSLQIGVSLQNIGWQLKGFYSEEGEPRREMLPLNLSLGISYRIPKAPLRFGMTIHNLQSPRLGYTYTNPYTPELKEEPEDTRIKPIDMVFRHTIFYLDIIPRKDLFHITLSYNHRRNRELSLTDQRAVAGWAIGGGFNVKGFKVGFAMSQLTRANFSYQVSLGLNINQLIDLRYTPREPKQKLTPEQKEAEKARKAELKKQQAAERAARQEEISRRLAGFK